MLSIPLGIAVALAVNYIMFVFMRLLFGAMLAGTFLSLYVARLELCDPPHRLVVTMGAGFCWVAGELLLPGLALAWKEWRILQGGLTLGLALLATCWWFPSLFLESARWLLATRQLEKGKRVLQVLAEGNGVHLDEEFYTQEHLLAERDSLPEGEHLPQYQSICKVFSTRVIWKNSLILSFTAFIGSGIRHCFTRNLTPYAPRFYFPYYLLAVSEAVALLFLCLTVDHFGRRGVLLVSTILTGVSSLLLLALTQYLTVWLILVLSVLGILASQAMAALSVLFAGEVLPTVVRGAGLGLLLAASTVGQAAAPLMDIHNSRGFFLHHVVFASFAILSVLSIMLLPESSHRPLPDSLREGEHQRRPPLFHSRRRHKDHMPLLSPHPAAGPYDPDSYARLVTATKKMLGTRHASGSCRGRQLLLEPPRPEGAQEEK
ncbi:putative solute carrier family 22 member 31 [Tiliqua scincoides]|uniref:putative solute carrier family 22 member 31 n=1 Tax=Tiliqua scincoides TaxID=71010 RepID=UPI0034627921